MPHGTRLSAIPVLVVAFGIALAPAAACAQDGWRALRIDGSSPASFQASVASLQNALPTSQRADFEAADERYSDRELVVSGEFVRIVPDGQGHPDLRLATSEPAAPWGADLIPIAHEPAARLRPGQRVTVSCQRMAGSGEDRWLQNCAIATEAEDDGAEEE